MSATQEAVHLLANCFTRSLSEWNNIADELRQKFSAPDDTLTKERTATIFILTWMRELRSSQQQFGQLFGRKKQPPIADDFTAAVAFCLEQFLAARGYPHRVRCEATTHKQRGALRPDISVLSIANSPVATVECKTNLGWNRSGWELQNESRCDSLSKLFPGCKSFMCVLTEKNWNSEVFLNSPLNGDRWYCLSKVAVKSIDDPADAIRNPIEPMLFSIQNLLAEQPSP